MEMSCKCVCHAVRSRVKRERVFLVLLSQSMSLSDNKMAALGFVPVLDLLGNAITVTIKCPSRQILLYITC